MHLFQRAPVDELGGLLRRTGREAAVRQLAIITRWSKFSLQTLRGSHSARGSSRR